VKKYKKLITSAGICSVFIALAIPLHFYILSLPLTQIAEGNCSDFSGYHLANCIAFYQRKGDVEALQEYAYAALWILWAGLFIGGVCSFFVFPRFALSLTLKVYILVFGLLIALLLACIPLILFAELITDGFIFTLSLVTGLLTVELALVSSTRRVISMVEPVALLP